MNGVQIQNFNGDMYVKYCYIELYYTIMQRYKLILTFEE